MNIKINFISWKKARNFSSVVVFFVVRFFMRWMLMMLLPFSSWWRLKKTKLLLFTCLRWCHHQWDSLIRCRTEARKMFIFRSHKSFHSTHATITVLLTKFFFSVYNRHMNWGFIVLENSIDKIYVFTDEPLEDYFVRNVDNKIHKHALP